MYLLGISYGIDSAAVLVKNGEVVAAAQQERFDRIKHSSNFPSDAINFCLAYAGIKIDNIDYITFFWNPAVEMSSLNKRASSGWRNHMAVSYTHLTLPTN